MNCFITILFCCLVVSNNGVYQRGKASYYAQSMNGRIIDVSWAAAKKLNFVCDGLAQVKLTIIDTIPFK